MSMSIGLNSSIKVTISGFLFAKNYEIEKLSFSLICWSPDTETSDKC